METLQPFSKAIIEAINDEYPPTAVLASAVAYNMLGNNAAAENLKQFCLSENPDISLMAIYSLLYLENKEPFVETIWQVRGMPDRDYNTRAACLDFLGSMGLVPNTPEYRD
jgi:HEAT repeat protein